MPIYVFQHPRTKRVIEVVQRMSEPHIYKDAKGVQWERVLVNPQVGINTRINANDSKDFVNKTRGKNYSLGDLWDASAELSEKRGGMTGKDEVKHKAEEAYKKRTGKAHPHSKKAKAFENSQIKIEF